MASSSPGHRRLGRGHRGRALLDSRRPGKAYCLRKSKSVRRSVEILHHQEGAVGRGAFYTHVPALPVGPEVHCANGPAQFDMVAVLQIPQDQLVPWLEGLSHYDMVIQHRPARRHCNVDALSRLPVSPGGCGTRLDVHPGDLPCGGFLKCKRAHDNWNAFAEEVDDVGLLSKPGCWSCELDMGEY